MKRFSIRCLANAALLFVAAAMVLVLATSAWACPGCKDALAANDGEQGNLVAGYFWSICFMMSMPFLLLAAFGSSMYLAVRRARGQQAAGAQQHAAAQPKTGLPQEARVPIPAAEEMAEV
jgi:hypothetical protein